MITITQNMRSTLDELHIDNCQEMLNDARQIKAEAMQAFAWHPNSRNRLPSENIYWQIMDRTAFYLSKKTSP